MLVSGNGDVYSPCICGGVTMVLEPPKMRHLEVSSETDDKIVVVSLTGLHMIFQKPISDRWIQHRDNGKLVSLELRYESC